MCMMLASTDWEKRESRKSVWGTRCVCSSLSLGFAQQISERVVSGTNGSQLGLLSVVEFSRTISRGYYCQVCKLRWAKTNSQSILWNHILREINQLAGTSQNLHYMKFSIPQRDTQLLWAWLFFLYLFFLISTNICKFTKCFNFIYFWDRSSCISS